MSEDSLSQSPGPAGLWLDATRRGLLWALETEEKGKHCPLASGCGHTEAQPAGDGRSPAMASRWLPRITLAFAAGISFLQSLHFSTS